VNVDINWVAVLAGTIASMFSGMVWYNPNVFGKKWMKAVGLTQKQAESGQMMGMMVAIIRSFLLSFALFHIIYVTAAFYSEQSFLDNAVGVGLWVGLAIVAATMFMHDTFEQRPKMATKVHVAYEIVNVFLVAVVIGLVTG